MFSDPEVIEASRKFVCIRIDSYASEENQKIVRSYLNGRFANTAFCILAPDGKERLTRSGRSPQMALGGDVASSMDEIAARYQTRGDLSEAALPDFPSFKLALNVAAADQRLLVLLAGSETKVVTVEKRLRSLAWDPEMQGRYHYDSDSTGAWKKPLSHSGDDTAPGIYIVEPDAFGLEGKIVTKLPMDAPSGAVRDALAKANAEFAKTTEKKDYSAHVSEGRREGISIEMAMPFGEDRDGDGEIDARGRNRRR